MTVSRRLFIKAASGAALIASLPQTLLSQDKRKPIQGRPAGRRVPPTPSVSYGDPLYYYNSAAFSSYIGSIFRVYVPQQKAIDLNLIDVRQLKPPVPGKEGFSLVFEDSAPNRLPSGLYKIEHAALGTFCLMLGPVNKNRTTYEAVINRQYP